MNRFTFKISNPKDSFSVPFNSMPIQADCSLEAYEILSRTYQAKYGFILELICDWFQYLEKMNYEKLLLQSLNSAML